jgi:hypothetical protein
MPTHSMKLILNTLGDSPTEIQIDQEPIAIHVYEDRVVIEGVRNGVTVYGNDDAVVEYPTIGTDRSTTVQLASGLTPGEDIDENADADD